MDAALWEPDTGVLSLVAELRAEIAQLRREVSVLRCEVGFWKSRHADAVKRNVKLRQELDQAHAEIRQLKAALFGKKSEKQTSTDRSNDLEDPQNPRNQTRGKRGQRPDRPGPDRRDYSHLPVVLDPVVELSPDEQNCSHCGKPLCDLGTTEDSEQIEINVKSHRRKIRRRRYRKTCDCPGPRTITAPAPPKLIPKSRYGMSVWIHLLLEKFASQRPIQRTIEQLQWYDLSLSAGTINDGLKRIGPLFEPIYEALRRRVLQATFFHADETRWLVFQEIAGKIGYRWWLWVFAGQDAVVYVLDPTRSHHVPESFFGENVQGVLMVDRYSAYKAMVQVHQGVLILAFCWAHVRRDFVRVGKGYPELKEWALTWLRRIRELYRLHRPWRHPPELSPESQSAEAALRRHVAAMAEQRAQELADPKLRMPCAKALASLNEHWDGLTKFLDDRRIPLDNNQGERLMRQPAVGRKNYYGSGAKWSGQLAAKMFSLLETLKCWEISPRAWLSWYLNACAQAGGKAPPDVELFLPWNLSQERKDALNTPTISPESSNTS